MPGRPLRVSFDLDACLVCYDPAVPCEPNRVPLLLRPWFREPLRLGTKLLMDELTRRNVSIWVYTTSYRSPRYLKWWFRFHGIRLAGVVNQQTHDAVVQQASFERRPSKYPKAFGIDLHVDDSEGVRMEGEQYGFDVLVVRPDALNWTQQVIDAVDAKSASSQNRCHVP